MNPLPQPEIVSCYSDVGFIPPITAMLLRWPAEAGAVVSTWRMPGGERFDSPPPRRFAVRICRQFDDAYAVTFLWDAIYRQWFSLRRAEILGSALAPVLTAMGRSLDQLLDQPIDALSRVA